MTVVVEMVRPHPGIVRASKPKVGLLPPLGHKYIAKVATTSSFYLLSQNGKPFHGRRKSSNDALKNPIPISTLLWHIGFIYHASLKSVKVI